MSPTTFRFLLKTTYVAFNVSQKSWKIPRIFYSHLIYFYEIDNGVMFLYVLNIYRKQLYTQQGKKYNEMIY